MIAAKRILRKAQRQLACRKRKIAIEEIMESKGDPTTFYKLVRQQRSSTSMGTEFLTLNGKTAESIEEVTQTWAQYFQQLATPTAESTYDDLHLGKIQDDINLINQICNSSHQDDIPTITKDEIHTAIYKLNNSKAADIFGITAEHFKLAGPSLITALHCVYNRFIKNQKIPESIKRGILTPIYKKGAPDNPGNYRGITVTPVILKTFEHIIRQRHQIILEETQSRLQTGFTKGTSPLVSARPTYRVHNRI
ncbi:uncharacterized protein LOC117339794 [Pecten maximus]|uniref:uncharacterized protein LOC117339794 n=1 Tax=Pecten maximus TaxID=6579 RepID=UPI001458E2A8|nr:uncharacterized protein LOC117339794 [Pecten maximus]